MSSLEVASKQNASSFPWENDERIRAWHKEEQQQHEDCRTSLSSSTHDTNHHSSSSRRHYGSFHNSNTTLNPAKVGFSDTVEVVHFEYENNDNEPHEEAKQHMMEYRRRQRRRRACCAASLVFVATAVIMVSCSVHADRHHLHGSSLHGKSSLGGKKHQSLERREIVAGGSRSRSSGVYRGGMTEYSGDEHHQQPPLLTSTNKNSNPTDLSASVSASGVRLGRTSSTSNNNNNNNNNNMPFVHDATTTTLSSSFPFSTYSPQKLGLELHNARPAWSSPGPVFGTSASASASTTQSLQANKDNAPPTPPTSSSSSSASASSRGPLPTNKWFQNLLIGLNNNDDNTMSPYATEANNVYTIPYVIDPVGPIPGIRLHHPRLLANDVQVQVSYVSYHGLTLGMAFADNDNEDNLEERKRRRRDAMVYTIDEETLPHELGVGLRWDTLPTPPEQEQEEQHGRMQPYMRTSILRGMPYATMQYTPRVIPAISSELTLVSPPLVDGETQITHCSSSSSFAPSERESGSEGESGGGSRRMRVESEIQMTFEESDYTWLVFFSRPVDVECFLHPDKALPFAESGIHLDSHKNDDILEKNSPREAFQLRVVPDDNMLTQPIMVRMALLNTCTHGVNANECTQRGQGRNVDEYAKVLRRHKDVYPSNPNFSYEMVYGEDGNEEEEEGRRRMEAVDGGKEENKRSRAATAARVVFDWQPRSMKRDVLDWMVEEQSVLKKQKQKQQEEQEEVGAEGETLHHKRTPTVGGKQEEVEGKGEFYDAGSSESSETLEAVKWFRKPSLLSSSSTTTIPQEKKNSHEKNHQEQPLLMYALPHHVSLMEDHATFFRQEYHNGLVIKEEGDEEEQHYCMESLHGQACLVQGGRWELLEALSDQGSSSTTSTPPTTAVASTMPSFYAPRPPHPTAIPSLVDAIQQDISYQIPANFMRGAGDTYFSGKMLAKLGRILVITHELKQLAMGETPTSYAAYNHAAAEEEEDSETGDFSLAKVMQAVNDVKEELPSDEQVSQALEQLKLGVQVWLNGTAEAKFVYDEAWGGLVSCGCWFNEGLQRCDNAYPDCPAFSDPGLDFGHAFYNDHHFHHGYHIYAAAVASHFDPVWGRNHFENVLSLIRDIANPSAHDKYFPMFRHKDWYLGSSWASGVVTYGGKPYMNGRNQESSSEAIAAYEATALYGDVMMNAWKDVPSSFSKDKLARAKELESAALHVREVGRLLTSTELRAAQRYWHVPKESDLYPSTYAPKVIGMMWSNMVQFQTWFGRAPYLAYGIQLLPLTPVSERRDTISWARELYKPFAESCVKDPVCEEQGWSVLQYAILSTVGHRDDALSKANALPSEVFISAGGSGHSLSNTLWYIATRPDIQDPLDLSKITSASANSETKQDNTPDADDIHCGCESTCTAEVKDTLAGGHTCVSRIQWLVGTMGKSELDACSQVGGVEYKQECGGCDPSVCQGADSIVTTSSSSSSTSFSKDSTSDAASDDATGCPPCSKKVCHSDLNRCPRASAPYLCLKGASRGGCSPTPWMYNQQVCVECCELSDECV